jgi:hypothetical protein
MEDTAAGNATATVRSDRFFHHFHGMASPVILNLYLLTTFGGPMALATLV